MNKTLLILAAGMGSRFGGLKQLEPVGPSGEFIIDYSIYDAIRNGFNKIVFIIKEENYEIFRETVGKRIEDKVNVEYVFQSLDNIPSGYNKGSRVKPWGTAHAILCAKDVIHEPFVIINADDFYGNDAYSVISKFIDNNENCFSLVGYDVINTLTSNGSVKRGVCIINNGYLESIDESVIERVDGVIHATSLVTNREYTIDSNTKVSMNMMSFTPSIFKYLEDKFKEFLDENKDNLEKCEYLIPTVLANGIKDGKEVLVYGLSEQAIKNLNNAPYFWHERNSLRMVDKLDLLPDDNGNNKNLNLTFAVRDGIISHCGELKTVNLKPRTQDIDLTKDFIRSGQFEPATWEGCAVKISDKIAYLGRDIEDAIRLGFITDKDLEELKDIADENIVLNTTTLMHRMIVDICRESSPECGIVLGEVNKKLIDNVLAFNNKHIYLSNKSDEYRDYCKMILSWIYRLLVNLYDYDKTVENINALPYNLLKRSFLDWIYTYTDIDYIPKDKREKYKKFQNF